MYTRDAMWEVSEILVNLYQEKIRKNLTSCNSLVYDARPSPSCQPNWCHHKLISAICISEKLTMIYNMIQEVDSDVGANKSGIVQLYEAEKKESLVDVTIPMDITLS
eukprot:2084412-Ditylum_brightwellii.AAC.1